MNKSDVEGYERFGLKYSEFEKLVDWDNVELEVNRYTMSPIEMRSIYVAQVLRDNKLSIRQTSKETCVCRTTIHRDIHNVLPNVSYVLYDEVKSLLKSHMPGSLYCIKRKMEERRKRR